MDRCRDDVELKYQKAISQLSRDLQQTTTNTTTSNNTSSGSSSSSSRQRTEKRLRRNDDYNYKSSKMVSSVVCCIKTDSPHFLLLPPPVLPQQGTDDSTQQILLAAVPSDSTRLDIDTPPPKDRSEESDQIQLVEGTDDLLKNLQDILLIAHHHMAEYNNTHSNHGDGPCVQVADSVGGTDVRIKTDLYELCVIIESSCSKLKNLQHNLESSKSSQQHEGLAKDNELKKLQQAYTELKTKYVELSQQHRQDMDSIRQQIYHYHILSLVPAVSTTTNTVSDVDNHITPPTTVTVGHLSEETADINDPCTLVEHTDGSPEINRAYTEPTSVLFNLSNLGLNYTPHTQVKPGSNVQLSHNVTTTTSKYKQSNTTQRCELESDYVTTHAGNVETEEKNESTEDYHSDIQITLAQETSLLLPLTTQTLINNNNNTPSVCTTSDEQVLVDEQRERETSSVINEEENGLQLLSQDRVTNITKKNNNDISYKYQQTINHNSITSGNIRSSTPQLETSTELIDRDNNITPLRTVEGERNTYTSLLEITPGITQQITHTTQPITHTTQPITHTTHCEQLITQLVRDNHILIEQLHKAQGLLGGYEFEQLSMADTIESGDKAQLQLAEALEATTARLNEAKIDLQRLYQQKTCDTPPIVSPATEMRVDLLDQLESLSDEKDHLLSQLQTDRERFESQLQSLEDTLASQQIQNDDSLKIKSDECEDLTDRVTALQRQVNANEKFIMCQSEEREQERYDHQIHTNNLVLQISKLHNNNSDNKQLIQPEDSLSQATMNNDKQSKLMNECEELKSQLFLSQRFENESHEKCLQLQKELKTIKNTDNHLLQEKLIDTLQQLSLTNSNIESLHHNSSVDKHTINDLKHNLNSETGFLHNKEKEVNQLVEQLNKFQTQLSDKQDEISHLSAELDIGKTTFISIHSQHENEIERLQAEVCQLKQKLEEQTDNSRQLDLSDDSLFPRLAQNLLEDKNCEIDQLQAEVDRLRSTSDHHDNSSQHDEDDISLISKLKSDIESKNIQIQRLEDEITLLHRDTVLAANREFLVTPESTEISLNQANQLLQTQIQQLKSELSLLNQELNVRRQLNEESNDENIGEIILEKDEIIEQLKTQIENYKNVDPFMNESVVNRMNEYEMELQCKNDLLEQLDNQQQTTMAATDSNSGISAHILDLLFRVYQEGLQVLSLSELTYLKQHSRDVSSLTTGSSHPMTGQRPLSPIGENERETVDDLRDSWTNVKHQMLLTIQSLKDLVIQMNVTMNMSENDLIQADWRVELLKSIQSVFTSERAAIMNELSASSVLNPDLQSDIERLEKQIIAQDKRQNDAFSELLAGDHASLLAEITSLHTAIQQHTANTTKQQNEQYQYHSPSKQERYLNKQLQTLQSTLEEEGLVQNELKSSLDRIHTELLESKQKCQTISLDNNKQRNSYTQLKQLHEKEKSMLEAVIGNLESEKVRCNSLEESLVNERYIVDQYKVTLQDIQQDHSNTLVELDRCNDEIKQLQSKLNNERSNSKITLSQLREQLSQLQGELDHNKSLLREKQFSWGISGGECQSSIEIERAGSLTPLIQYEQTSMIEVQKVLESEKQKVTDMARSLERARHTVNHLNRQLVNERQKFTDAENKMRDQILILQRNNEQLMTNLNEKETNLSKLQQDKLKLKTHLETMKRETVDHQLELESERLMERRRVREQDRLRVNEVDQQLEKVYARYLRAESFRKNLVYQKKYLLLLIGGFRECESNTLAMIISMGGIPRTSETTGRYKHSHAFIRFRSAVRAVIAVHRLKYLVRKWHHLYNNLTLVASGGDREVSVLTVAKSAVAITHSRPHTTNTNTGTGTGTGTVGNSVIYGHTYEARDRTLTGCSPPVKDRPQCSNIDIVSSGASVCSTASVPDDSVDPALLDYIHRLENLQVKLADMSTSNNNKSDRNKMRRSQRTRKY